MDRYTKTVLTGILLCLVYLCFWMTAIPARAAQPNFTRVVLIGWDPPGANDDVLAFSDHPLLVKTTR